MKKALNEIALVLEEKDNFLVTSHINPDGDAAGSMAAMGFILKSLGKSFTIYNESKIPDKFSWLAWPARVSDRYVPGRHDWAIVLDCGDLSRVGDKLAEKITESIINIDHHTGNPDFGTINWVDTSASSVGEMVAGLADKLQIKLQDHLARSIYLALVSDTGFFSYGNTTSQALVLSSRLLQNGIDPGEINPLILNQWTRGKLRLHGMAMQNADFHARGSIGIISVSRKMMDQTGTSADDCEGLVSAIRQVKGVKVAVSIREDKPGRIKFSLRSCSSINVQQMARQLGGGGHKNASGGVIHAPLDQARAKILQVILENMA
ncbi:MAG: DHH family phosphoesterase [Desulfonatronovibrionaceae bacterium]